MGATTRPPSPYRLVSEFRSARLHAHAHSNGLFDRATPDGYPEADSAYTDSNAMVQRWRFAQDLAGDIAALVPESWKQEPGKSDPPDDGWSQRVIDLLAIRLTGRPLGETSNAAALQMLNETTGHRAERIQKFAPFMAQLPEANLR